jgi:formylglycine-generating enzyme required for sulfatase activity
MFWHIDEIIGNEDRQQYQIKANLFNQAHEVIKVGQTAESYRMQVVDYPNAHTNLLTKIQKEEIHRRLIEDCQRWQKVSIARPEIIDIFMYQDQLCYVEKKIDASPLSVIDQSLSLYEGLILLKELLSILNHIHEQRTDIGNQPLLHLNLSPDTVYLTTDQEFYFIHFDFSVLVELRAKFERQAVGQSVSGVAPEISRGRYAEGSDLFALGMTILSAMTAMPIHQIDQRIQANAFFEHDLIMPKPIQALFEKLVHYKLSERFSCVDAVIKAINALPPNVLPKPSPDLYFKNKVVLPEIKDEQISVNPKNNHVSTQALIIAAQPEPNLDDELEVEVLNHLQENIPKSLIISVTFFLVLILLVGVYWFNFRQSSAPEDSKSTSTAQNPQTLITQPQILNPSHENKEQLKITPSKATIQWIKIPAGSFSMGSTDDLAYENEKPVRLVHIKAFEISATEITVAQYRACVDKGVCDLEETDQADWGDSQHCNYFQDRMDWPMNCISWHQADQFAKWVDGHLPSEAQWEYVAKSLGKTDRYPWGETSKGCKFAVLADTHSQVCKYNQTQMVCSIPQGNTLQGVCDMIGNVAEWTADEYHPDYKDAPLDDQPWITSADFKSEILHRSYRGSAFDEQDDPRVSKRGEYAPDTRRINLGFRVVRYE